MTNIRLVLAGAGLCLILSACVSSEQQNQPQPSGLGQDYASPETPPPERVAGLLQEAKQQYDDRHYQAAFRFARQAEQLVAEHKLNIDDQATGLVIQGYCMLQMSLIDDYSVTNFGRQPGAISKFKSALELRPNQYPNNFRSRLGIALSLFRRHGDSIRKAESIDAGVLSLVQIKEDLSRAFAAQPDAAQRRREAARRHSRLSVDRDKLIKLGYVFQDPSTVVSDDKEAAAELPWLGGMPQNLEDLAIKDIKWILDDANDGKVLENADRDRALKAASDLADSWRKVRQYWRMAALRDLQDARDRFLDIRKTWPKYFWVDRDLTFVYQSLAGFFLDIGLEQSRIKAISAGVMDDRLEVEARRIYLSDEFATWEKEQSQRNYKVALDFTISFIRQHRYYEQMREERRDQADYSDMNENPFLVDLVQRFRATMDELIAEERGMRASMILEAAALCIDPIYQLNDIPQAMIFADMIKALAPTNPIHYFVRATAQLTAEDFEAAKGSYQAFLKESSISANGNQRKLAMQRISECDARLKRAAQAGDKG